MLAESALGEKDEPPPPYRQLIDPNRTAFSVVHELASTLLMSVYPACLLPT